MECRHTLLSVSIDLAHPRGLRFPGRKPVRVSISRCRMTPMYSDPGWGAAFRSIRLGNNDSDVRPAINAARARILPSLIGMPLLFGTLLFLENGNSESTSGWALAVFVLVVLSCFAFVMWIRSRPHVYVREGDIPGGLIQASGLIAAIGTAPMLWGYLVFFMGGGIFAFGLGAASSVFLLLGPGRPSKSLMRAWAERLGPEFSTESLWNAVLSPD